MRAYSEFVCVPGPMVYGICFCPISKKQELKDLKVAGNLFTDYIFKEK